MADFDEIEHVGGRIIFRNDGSWTFENVDSGGPAAVYQVCVSVSGKVLELLDVVPFVGNGVTTIYPQPSLVVMVGSDKHGMFGRNCPKCQSYFRKTRGASETHCPYCAFTAGSVEFTTKNQLDFIGMFCQDLIKAEASKQDFEINIGSMTRQLSENKSPWVYSEQQQQRQFQCSYCDVKYDILGDYGGCPGCGKLNAREVIDIKLKDLESQIQDVDETVVERNERAIHWEKLTVCVSEFEGLANYLLDYFLRIPATTKRKKDLRAVSFQRFDKANDCFSNWFGFDFLENIPPVDRIFLNKMFNRRHLVTHKAGRVDQEYLNNTGDTSVRINEVIRFKHKDILRLLPLIRLMSFNLIDGYESIH